jgi:NAD-dependent dihydropyrimidine dehydrogenase PreA subunit
MPSPVLLCRCAHAATIPADRQAAVLDGLAACGRPVTVVDDLCGLAAHPSPMLQTLVASAERLTVIACHPRAVRWLLERASANPASAQTDYLDMRSASPEAILAAVASEGGMSAVVHVPDEPSSDASDFWRPWFPVIDYDRCVNCRQCLEFCLFGVYEADSDGRVAVAHPDHCKNNCPSCARLCPHVAIMFPKIEEESPVSGTDDDPALAAGQVRLTRDQLFKANGHLLDKLRARQARPRLLKDGLY